MEVKINKEIREYTESIFFGLSMRQCFFSAIACIVAVILYFVFIGRLGMELTSWLCMLGASPFAMLGFIKYQGMNAEQIVMTMIRSFILKQRQLIFQPVNIYYECLKDNIEYRLKEDVKKHDKRLRKIKKAKQK